MQIASNFCQEKHPLANEISGNKASNYKNLQNGNAVSFRDDPKTEKKVVYKIQNYFWFFSAVCICISLEKARETWIHGKITSIQINEGTYASTCCSFRWWCFAARGRASISILFGRIFSLFFHKVSKVQTSNHVLRPEEKDRVDLQHRSKFFPKLNELKKNPVKE